MHGRKIIRLDHRQDCYPGYFVHYATVLTEGVAPSLPFFLYTGNEPRTNLLCHYKDGKMEFSNSEFKGNCNVLFLGINEKSAAFGYLKVYPNPTSGKGIITFQNNENTCINLEIYDLNGKRIFTNSSQTTYITFDINAFENGVYVYKLMNEKGEFSSGRILKQ